MDTGDLIPINTVEDFTERYGFPSAGHPLLSINRLQGTNYHVPPQQTIQVNLYSIVFKQGVKGLSRYGWREYDFSKGLMSFFAPGQILHWDESVDLSDSSGWLVVFHPDFLRRYPLGTAIDNFKFFAYEANEALHLSDAERQLVEAILENIERECRNNLDAHSQDIIVSQLGVLLSYADRFYQRQFRTRHSVEADVVTRVQALLRKHFEAERSQLMTAQDLASELAMSTHYLGELLRTLTGQTTQQHIHAHLIERAKSLLLTTRLSANEIAFRLGFEYPQYFSRLFKSKTGVTPLEYRTLN